MRLSKMTGKLEGVQACNTSPLDNSFCDLMSKVPGTICRYCYSRDMLHRFRTRCRPSWKLNGEELSDELLDTFPVVTTELFRINAHGELINVIHARNMLRLAKANPNTKVGLWTKRPNLVWEAIKLEGKPDNVSLVYSSPWVNLESKPPRDFDHTFTVFDYDTNINCGGHKCNECRLCYDSKVVAIREVIR